MYPGKVIWAVKHCYRLIQSCYTLCFASVPHLCHLQIINVLQFAAISGNWQIFMCLNDLAMIITHT